MCSLLRSFGHSLSGVALWGRIRLGGSSKINKGLVTTTVEGEGELSIASFQLTFFNRLRGQLVVCVAWQICTREVLREEAFIVGCFLPSNFW